MSRALDLLYERIKTFPQPKMIIVSPYVGAKLFELDPDILGLDVLRVDPYMPDGEYIIASKNWGYGLKWPAEVACGGDVNPRNAFDLHSQNRSTEDG